MGVMFKLFKNKQITMDLRTFKRKRRMLTLDGNIIYADQNDDQQVQAEIKRDNERIESAGDHIMKLYKFLADKSKKARDDREHLHTDSETNLHHNNNSYNSPVRPQEENRTRLVEVDDKVAQQQNNQQINHLFNNSEMNGESKNYATINRFDTKRDILLKVRHHIYERKRQRRLAQLLVKDGLSVWRPW